MFSRFEGASNKRKYFINVVTYHIYSNDLRNHNYIGVWGIWSNIGPVHLRLKYCHEDPIRLLGNQFQGTIFQTYSGRNFYSKWASQCEKIVITDPTLRSPIILPLEGFSPTPNCTGLAKARMTPIAGAVWRRGLRAHSLCLPSRLSSMRLFRVCWRMIPKNFAS